MSERVGIYPGSFDPITHGHEDIVRRGLGIVDRLIVAVAYKATQEKRGIFSVEERVELIGESFAGEKAIEVASFDGLLVDFARARGATIIMRGLRAVSDFEYEFQMARMNRQLSPGIETIFLAPDVRYSFLSASLVREIASLGGNIDDMVAPHVKERLRRHFGGRN